MVCFGYIIVNILHKSDNNDDDDDDDDDDDNNNNNNNNNNTYIFGHCMRPYSSKYNPGSSAETFLGLFYMNAKLVIFLCQIW
jgi:hypothetical protein